MEEKKRTITKVEKKVDETTDKKVKKADSLTAAEEKSKATTNRIVAFILWAVALACEIIAILLINEKIKLPYFSAHDDVRVALWIPLVIFIVIDLICCIIASQLWKKASRLDPFKKTDNAVGFFILTQLGAIMAIICLVPLIIFVLANKKLDKKTKTFVTIVAGVALLIAVLLGVDWHPISQDEKTAATQTITQDVFWSQYGRKYHLFEDCQTIRNSDLLTGSVQDAIDNKREELCAFCAKRGDIHNDEMKIEERSDVEELLETATTPEE